MDAMHWDPFGEMAALRGRMNRMLEGMLPQAEGRRSDGGQGLL